MSEITNTINEEYLIIAPGQRKILVSILHDKVCEEHAFPSLLPMSEFGFNAPRDIRISLARYFDKRLLNFSKYFASDANYIFFARFIWE